MLKLAKVLVMVVRVVGLIAIVMGAAIGTGRGLPLLSAHIGLGFLVALALLILAVIAITRGQFIKGVLGLIFAVLLPAIGFAQFPLKFGSQIGAAQVGHVVVVLASLGMAEILGGALRRQAG